MKRLLIIGFYLLGLWYLLTPSPVYPDLTGGARSDEPGDTWQNPDQKGFYANLDRQTVLADLQRQYTLRLGPLVLPSYRLNYRPEEAYELVRDQLQSYYLEEIVYPLRESLFVNGWEPKKSPIYAGIPTESISEISLHGIPYDAKITLRPVSSPVWARILIWSLIFPSLFLVSRSLGKSFGYEKN